MSWYLGRLTDNAYFLEKARQIGKVIDNSEALLNVPYLKEDLLAKKAAIETQADDINVGLMHQYYLRGIKHYSQNVQLTCNSRVDLINKDEYNGTWEVVCNVNSKNEKIYQSNMIVNATNAWADDIAKIANTKS